MCLCYVDTRHDDDQDFARLHRSCHAGTADRHEAHHRASNTPWRPPSQSARSPLPAQAGRRDAPCGVSRAARASGRSCASRSRRPAATTIRRWPRRPRSAIELLHCASLVHDDLPCFDDAPMRRGRASVHFAYRREPGGARRRRADRAGLPDAGGGAAQLAAAAGAAARHDRRAASACRPASSPARPGNASRGSSLTRLPARQDRRAVRRGHDGRRAGRRAPSRALARARRLAGRGLPGRRRHPRRGRRPAGARQADRPRRRAAASERRRSELGLRRRDRAFRPAGRPRDRRRARLPRRRGRCARWCGSKRERLVPKDAVATSSCASPPEACDAAAALHRPPMTSLHARAAATARWSAGVDRWLALARPPAGEPAFPAPRRRVSRSTRPSRAAHARELFDLVRRLRLLAGAARPACSCACSSSWPTGRRRWRALAHALGLPRRSGAPPARCGGRAAPGRAPQRRPLSASARSARRWSATPAVAAMVEHHAALYADLPIRSRLLRATARREHSAWRATGPTPAPPTRRAGSPTDARARPTRR